MQDILDWLDFRPDVGLWPLLAVPALFLASAAFAGVSITVLMLIAALILTVAVATVMMLFAAAWVLANALVDVTLFHIGRIEQRMVKGTEKPRTGSIARYIRRGA